jgi:hypothetical protein
MGLEGVMVTYYVLLGVLLLLGIGGYVFASAAFAAAKDIRREQQANSYKAQAEPGWPPPFVTNSGGGNDPEPWMG